MCGCIERVENGVENKLNINGASFLCKTLIPANRLYGEIEYKPTTGRKKSEKINIIFPYCPLCGEKYPDFEESGKGA